MRNINSIILHCSDSDVKSHDNTATIRKWHVDERGFTDIGYHYIITKDGTIHECRPEKKAGAHAKGWNGKSLGICLTGKEMFSPDQIESLIILIKFLKKKYRGVKKVLGHCEVSSKTCPNFDYKSEIINKL